MTAGETSGIRPGHLYSAFAAMLCTFLGVTLGAAAAHAKRAIGTVEVEQKISENVNRPGFTGGSIP